ncbi:MAG TPA: FemAB family XrtA/PEP-CTERM system-associated protein [Nitrospira sp.]|nr:FemAB family XrtA/PEP-CTERM system-associated protein [Nitrospira sp.]
MKLIQVSNDQDRASWEQFVLGHPLASGYHTLSWQSVVHRVFGHQVYALMAKDEDGTVRGVLPLVLTDSAMFGRFLTSMAFFNYGGVVADGTHITAALLSEAAELAKSLRASHIELRHSEPLETNWPVRSHKVSMRLALPPQYDILLKAFPSKLRSQIKRAQKEDMEVRIGGEELLDDYYRVFSRCMRDLGTPVYGKRLFQAIVEAFPKEVRLCVVFLEGRPLASGLVYGFRRRLEIPWAASDRRYSRLAPNMLLYSAVLEYACREGYQEFDFGRSSIGGGTYRFKEQWGAKPHPLYWYYWLAEGRDVPQLNPENPKYKAAITVWRHLPLPVANLLGPHIVKYLP